MVNVNITINIEDYNLQEIMKFITLALGSVNINRGQSVTQTYFQDNLFAVIVKHKNIIRVSINQKP